MSCSNECEDILGVQTGGLGGGQNDVTALDTAPPHSQVPRSRIIFLGCAIAAPNRELHVQSEGVFHGRNRLQLLRAVVSYGLRRDQ
jgi:hypothetical protein